MENVSRTFKSRIYHLLERPASHRAALRRNRSVLIDTSKIQTDGKAKSSPADFVVSISCCQRRPVSTTVTIRSGDRIPITIRIAQSSQDCTGPALVSCLAVTFQAIQAAATLKPISDSGIPTLLVRKSSKSNTFLPNILKSDRDPKLRVQKRPMNAAKAVVIQVTAARDRRVYLKERSVRFSPKTYQPTLVE